LAEADRLIVVSRAAGEDFAAWPELMAKVRVVYNGLDFPAFVASGRREKFRGELGLGPDDFLIGQLGLISERKQTHLALEAFNRLAERFPHVHLAVVGSAAVGQEDYAAEVQRRASSSPFAGRIHFTGFRREIADVCAALELNLLISNQEGFGRVIIEAGAFGAPSIGARIGGIPEVIEEGRSGLLVDGGDAVALARAIAELLENPELYRQLREGVRQKVREEFGIERHIAAMQAIYDELLEVNEEKTN
jgi:glycosyltransferase involved in cell wall biosynthesis